MAMDGVEAVSGMGLMIGIQLKTKQAKEVVAEALKEGLMLLTAKDKVRLLPPLNISYEEIDKGLAILEKLI
jgi:acetylornithine/N-succinyldiaminopimelate aminotransferase